MATNTASVKFAGGNIVFVQGLANASYMQVITITPPSGAAAVFTGNGEGNVAMALTTPGFLTANSNPKGQASFTPPGGSSTLSTYTISVSSNGKSNPVEANSFTSTSPAGGQLNMAVVVSEDASDNDFNDGTVTFMQYTKS